MPSVALLNAVAGYEQAIKKTGATPEAIDCYLQATKSAFYVENDKVYGKQLAERTKQLIRKFIRKQSHCSFERLEEYSQKNGLKLSMIDYYYDVLLVEARDYLDSYMLYIERDRKRKDRFYEPRRKTLKQVTDKLQALEDAVMCENVLLASEIIKGVELGKFRYGDRNFYESGDVFNAVCKRGDVWLVEDKEGGYTLVKESGLRKCREEK